MRKPLVIYHGNCADGFTAAWCFWRRFGDSMEYHAGKYNRPLPDVDDRPVYIVDFSFTLEQTLELLQRARHRVVMLDHHETAIRRLTPHLPNTSDLMYLPEDTEHKFLMCLDKNRSGARLAWDYLNLCQPLPRIIKHVEDRDLWRFQYPETRAFQANLFSYQYDFKEWNKIALNAEQDSLFAHQVQDGEAIERKHAKDVAELVRETQRTMLIAGHRVPVANLPYTMASDGCLKLLELNPSAPFAACYYDTAERRIFSLRSLSCEGASDVATIAEQFGGGGHTLASGFQVPRDNVLALL